MSDLSRFRDHCAAMSTADHKPECGVLRNWREIRPDPDCTGCLTGTERALFARLAAEVDDYRTPHVDLFGELTDEPMEEA